MAGRGDESRRYAAECLAAAAKLKDEQARAVLIRTAEIWQRLAAKEDGVPQVQVPGGAVQQQIQPGDDKKE